MISMTGSILNFSDLESLRKDPASLKFHPQVQSFREKHKAIFALIDSLEISKQSIIYFLIVLGQKNAIVKAATREKLEKLADCLSEMDTFYDSIGGLIGYQRSIHRFISHQVEREIYQIKPPEAIDLRVDKPQNEEYILEGLLRQSQICEIWPCGGAADRLALIDKNTNLPYPAACYEFEGYSLLERLVRDLQAREYLHERCFHKKIETPILVMASREKQNFEAIKKKWEEHDWFGRSPDLVKIIVQPLVPMFDRKGIWVTDEKGDVIFRPGGHGVLWRLLEKSGSFEWLKEKGIGKAVVRQINNPVAGLDGGLLALIGIGFLEKKKFGFTSCPRDPEASEGVNVVKIFKSENRKIKQIVSNIEYCDFEALKQIDQTASFPANANTLFVDLPAVQKAQETHPFPGLILNFKSQSEEATARLESTMQNISDAIQLEEEGSAFLTYNERSRTLSPIKRQWRKNETDRETPERCFAHLMKEGYELLSRCGFKLPPMVDLREPPVTFVYHPALGPLYSVIAQKLRGGEIVKGSFLTLEIAELSMKNLYLNGSLDIQTKSVVSNMASCYLKNVSIEGDVRLTLGKRSLLILEDVAIRGIEEIKVADDACLIVKKGERLLELNYSSSLEFCDSLWEYQIVKNRIQLQLKLKKTVVV